MLTPEQKPDAKPLPAGRVVRFHDMAISTSKGPKSNPFCERRGALKSQCDSVWWLANFIEESPSGVEAWWSHHVWRGDRRHGANWESASATVIEFDFDPKSPDHRLPPHEAVEKLAREVSRLPGNIFVATPRGGRLVFVFDAPETDRVNFRNETRGALALVSRALRELGLEEVGFQVDRSAIDFARYWFTPRSTVRGQERSADVRVLREEVFWPGQLADHAPDLPPNAAPRRLRPSQEHSELARAAEQWNQDHPWEFGPAGQGSCPACGHNGCFGRLPQRSDKWTCFSSAHEATGCGRPGENAGWWGDHLDLEAHARGSTRAEVLRADGYLAPDVRRGLK